MNPDWPNLLHNVVRTSFLSIAGFQYMVGRIYIYSDKKLDIQEIHKTLSKVLNMSSVESKITEQTTSPVHSFRSFLVILARHYSH
jgi:hypothetical protein